ncbi:MULTISPECIES: amidase [Pseudomonas]|jgi:amidase|uniref:Amidase family protein n=3 Tax=Gammaproteobacteria TaxID=1236 RepID=A0A1T2ZEN2_PSEFL|nr:MULTISPECIES: amidase [Pseudomonas]MBC8784108.1 amidase [Pseudomonas fluorescens]MCI4606479.1 amidase [Pseudomonas fluorescens]OEC70180.1 amidase [Pseudomonas sp. AP19]OPB02608.1 amidase [Pseudomonas fluorescens]PQA95531.1 amidase [Pseudomonas fluorescens]
MSLSDSLLRHSATELGALIQQRKLSSTAIVCAYLARIEALNPSINALVQVCAEAALAGAWAADRAVANGEYWGALHGVPFTVKDVFDTRGVVSAVGLPERAHYRPEQDATVVTRMKAAGAILLGKSNCPPGGGGGVTDNPVYGATRNPHALAYSPGGSSGGEAAAIAAGLSPLGLGSDSGGSLRVPAHFCGVCTLKPTSGRVPNTGVFDHLGGLSDYRSQIGPMARHVEDLALALQVIAGEDGVDAGVIPMPLRGMQTQTLKGLRVAWYSDGGIEPVDALTHTTLQAVADLLDAEGALIRSAFPSALSNAREITERYWAMSQGSGAQSIQLFSDWDQFRTAMLGFMADYDIILCPVDAAPATQLGETRPGLFSHTLPYSLAGWPCVVVRAGTDSAGLPVGVQIVARPWHEHVALAAAAAIERALPFTR